MKILTYVSRKEAREAKRKLLEPKKKIENGFYFDIHQYDCIKELKDKAIT